MIKKDLFIIDEVVEITLILFKNVTNTKEILDTYNKISDKNKQSDTLDHFFLMLDGRLVFNEDHILHSIYRAYHNFKKNNKITKNKILEIFYLLSPDENINECLNQYKMKEDSTCLIYIGLNVSNDEAQAFTDLIQGETTAFKDICSVRDEQQILKIFKCEHISNIEKYIYHNIASKKINLN
ncbi:EKC/KEOPS complex subunit CGI121 [Hepatocystis sp. ex Piliocolobus tephrosceles]|nr:EKC/KEOPS complex subunit CGI121 [Hepatocystis sp. ex Piliocolobus tephrosceles]